MPFIEKLLEYELKTHIDKIIDKDAKNKFKWSWLFKLEKKCIKLHWQTVLGRSMCVGRLSVVSV